MTNEQYEALQTLQQIQRELNELGRTAAALVEDHFPNQRGWANAYKIFEFGYSCNPYDNTLEKLIENIELEDQEQYDQPY